MTDNEEIFNFICGAIIPREIYEKAKQKCEEKGTTIYEAIKSLLYGLANGQLTIYKKENKNDR